MQPGDVAEEEYLAIGHPEIHVTLAVGAFIRHESTRYYPMLHPQNKRGVSANGGEGFATVEEAWAWHDQHNEGWLRESLWPVETVKALDIFGVVHDTHATEAELNGWHAQQGALL